jgi:hypothetical protein
MLISLGFSSTSVIANNTVTVFAGEDEAQSPIFYEVIDGIDDMLEINTVLIKKTDVTPIAQTSDDKNLRIILGEPAAKMFASPSLSSANLLYGLMYFDADEHQGVSLTLDANTLTLLTKQVLPKIEHLYVVQQKSFETIDTSQSKSPIVALTGPDTIATIRLLGNLVEKDALPAKDAVVMPANLPNNILFEIVKIAWDRNITLLSTNLWHLDNGALMVFYPDGRTMGKQLGEIIEKKTPEFQHPGKINLAFNRAIAKHLGIDLNSSMLKAINMLIN